MKRKMRRAVFLMIACSSGVGLLISNAWAATAGYGGAACRPVYTTTSAWADYAMARNQSSSAATWVCGATQLGGAITKWRVSVRDTTPVGQVTCFARASGEFDTSGFVSPSESSGVSFTGTKELGVSLAGTSSYVANGSKNIQCDMPAAGGIDGSAVASYSITEL